METSRPGDLKGENAMDTTAEQPTSIPPVINPFTAALEGWSASDDDWPNTVSIRTITHRDPQQAANPTYTIDPDNPAAEVYADLGGDRELVEVDTNYKATRPGEHPVRLTRTAAVELVAHLLAATEDTFHYARCGRLRATEAAELLQALQEAEFALHDLREHAFQDLLHDTGIDHD